MTGSCTGTVDVIAPCTPNWLCYDPLNGYAYDAACGKADILRSVCNPTFVASNTVQYSNTTEQSTTTLAPTWTKLKSIIITTHGSGTILVKFDIRSSIDGKNVFGNVYHNGNYITSTGTVSPIYQTFSADISITLNINDTIELWGAVANNPPSPTMYTKNFYICYN